MTVFGGGCFEVGAVSGFWCWICGFPWYFGFMWGWYNIPS